MLSSIGTALTLGWKASRFCLVTKAFLTIVGGVTPIVLAWLMKFVLDGLTGAGTGSVPLVVLAVGVAVTGVVVGVLPIVSQYIGTEFDRSVNLIVRTTLFTAINRLKGLARLEDPRFHDQFQLAQQAGYAGPAQVISGLLGTTQSLVTAVGFIGTLVVLNPWLAIAVLAAGVVTVRAEFALSRRRVRVTIGISKTERRDFFYQSLQSRMDAAKELRLLNLGGFFLGRMLHELRKVNATRRRLDRQEMVTQGSLALLGALLTGGGLVWAITAASSGRLTPGDVSIFVMAVSGVQSGITMASSHLGGVHQAAVLLGEYRRIVEAEPDMPLAADPKPVTELGRGIELRDVWFRYSPDQPWVLRGVNLHIPAGRTTGLVGHNGAGKTTVVKLLCRLYDPTQGQVLWDGVDVRELDVEELRRRIGTIFQDFMTYELSAAENIGVGWLDALDDMDRITAAARRAEAHEIITGLPRGYQTLLSRNWFDQTDDGDQDGVLLSGGQWQRVALARAFIRDKPELLILDEPTAGLDARAEFDIHRRLDDYRAQNKTSLLISHRLGSVRTADHIVVLADGQVVEQGNHEELFARDELYAELFKLQATGYRN
ncbi:ABC transporter ATP-binding protein [Streptosporangium sp. KLBMP 9127]|nr:ABC transporter ATP-binding protein/permease [Streptosporangium sp. KLBMP 9127]